MTEVPDRFGPSLTAQLAEALLASRESTQAVYNLAIAAATNNAAQLAQFASEYVAADERVIAAVVAMVEANGGEVQDDR